MRYPFRRACAAALLFMLCACDGETATTPTDAGPSSPDVQDVAFDDTDVADDTDLGPRPGEDADSGSDAEADAGRDDIADIVPDDTAETTGDSGADGSTADVAPQDVSDTSDVLPDVADVADDTTDTTPEVESPPSLLGLMTTATSSLPATLEPRAGGVVLLDGSEGDQIRLRVVNTGPTTADAALRLWEPGGIDVVAFADPPGAADPVLPASGTIELTVTGTWEAEVRNRGATRAAFRFEVECVAGPCASLPPVVSPSDRDGDGTSDDRDNCPLDVNLTQADEDADGYGDACDGVDPWSESSDDALEAALRAEHTRTHRPTGYLRARELIFGSIDNEGGQVECVYTGLRITTTTIPPSTLMNTEHTWPQSRGADIDPMESDIHHLFPTESVANSTRNNFPFCDVVAGVTWSVGGSVKGTDSEGRTCFEPRESHRGNVARALFYFAVMYEGVVFNGSGNTVGNIEIWEEPSLRLWHVQDPPDARERARNAAIEVAQGSRNPFIDYPHLVDRIANF
ncbi:MAG: endonuclease [Myxococcales bacterium]|nr:endonuclease [Myxococcales bacterium]